MNLEKRIKRHVIGPRHEFFAVTLPGFESICANELASLSDTIETTGLLNGGVRFEGRLTDLYLSALHSRIAVRLLMRLARFKATNFGQLEKHTRDIPWELYLPEGTLPECHVTAHHSRLYHTGAIADHIAQAITARWSDLEISPAPSSKQVLFVRLEDDGVTISIDGCGDPLYQRGLKPHAAKAPLRETTAAGILSIAGFRPDAPLIDPMCGSGTFSLEAAMMAKAIPPGYFRDFSFMRWPAFRPKQWGHMKMIAGRQLRDMRRALVHASDSDKRMVVQLQDCIRENHLEDAISVSTEDFFGLSPRDYGKTNGLVVLNPPYGKRLTAKGDVEKQYREIAAKLRSDFEGWRAALLVPRKRLAQALGLSLKHRPVQHGGLDLTLLTGRI